MIRAAQFDAQCADCGAKIAAGQQMEYLPPSGDRPARTSHVNCPELVTKPPRGVNHAQREDPETYLVWRTCDGCGKPWTVQRTSPAARARAFLGHCCDGRYGWRACGDEPRAAA